MELCFSYHLIIYWLPIFGFPINGSVVNKMLTPEHALSFSSISKERNFERSHGP